MNTLNTLNTLGGRSLQPYRFLRPAWPDPPLRWPRHDVPCHDNAIVPGCSVLERLKGSLLALENPLTEEMSRKVLESETLNTQLY